MPAVENTTRIVYMPGRDLTLLAAQWRSEGLPAEFPCALVSRAAQADQEVLHTTLGELAAAGPVQAPSLLLAGWALSGARAGTEVRTSRGHAFLKRPDNRDQGAPLYLEMIPNSGA